MNLVRTKAPTTWAVTDDDALDHCRITELSETAKVHRLVMAAQGLVEKRGGGIALTSQEWRLTLEAFPSVIKVPRPPLLTVVSLKYIDENGVLQTLDAADYQLDADAMPATIQPAYGGSWPTTRDVPNAVQLTFTCGFAAASRPIPEEYPQAMLLLIGHWYENPEAVVTGSISTTIDLAVDALLADARMQFAFTEYDQ